MAEQDVSRATLILVALLVLAAVVGSATVIFTGPAPRPATASEAPRPETSAAAPTGRPGRPAPQLVHPERIFVPSNEAAPVVPQWAGEKFAPEPAGSERPVLRAFPSPVKLPAHLDPLRSSFALAEKIQLPEDPAERMRVVQKKLEQLDEEIAQARAQLRDSVTHGQSEARLEARRKVGLLLRERSLWVRRARAEGVEVPALVPQELKGLRLRAVEEGQ